MVTLATTTDEKNFRFRLAAGKKTRWDQMCRERKIPQQTAVESLIDFVLKLDPPTQLMVLGQLPPDPSLVEFVLRRLAGAPLPPGVERIVKTSRGEKSKQSARESAPSGSQDSR